MHRMARSTLLHRKFTPLLVMLLWVLASLIPLCDAMQTGILETPSLDLVARARAAFEDYALSLLQDATRHRYAAALTEFRICCGLLLHKFPASAH